jgi:hypothetical protein
MLSAVCSKKRTSLFGRVSKSKGSASEVLEEDRPRDEWIVAVDAFFRLHRGCKVEGEPTDGETLIDEVPGLAPPRERNPDANSPIGCRQLRPSRAVMR